MGDRLPRKLAAILYADVAGYSRLTGEDEDTTHRILTEYLDFISTTTDSHRGKVMHYAGDAVLAKFDAVVDAMSAAVAIQNELNTRNQGLPGERHVHFRIGVNSGDVIEDRGDIFGDGVNIAARLESLADPGGICISDAVRSTLGKKLDLDYENMGEQEVKNISEPVRAYKVVMVKAQATVTESVKPALELPDKPSIAVLPFTNMSGDPEQEYFSDGITEDIITELSRFSGLIVIARNSSFAYKDLPVDIKQVARELGVGYVMEGSVRRDGDRLRITAQLIKADSGGHIWGEKYDREVGDIFALQDEITRRVVGSIAPQVELAELERSRELSDTSLSAYELALKAQALTYDAVRVADPGMLDQAMSLANAALELDDRCTHALWTSGMGCVFQHIYGWGDDPGGALTSAIETADHLIGIDPSNAKSYVVRAWAHQYRREYDLALADYRRALELNPNLALNLFTMAWSEAVAGLATEAREHAQMALKLSPRDTDIWLGWAYATLELADFIEGDFAEAVKWGRLAIQMHARMPFRQVVMVAGYGYLGDLEAAKSHVDAVKAFAPDILPAVLSGHIEVLKLPEHNAFLVEGLRRAGL